MKNVQHKKFDQCLQIQAQLHLTRFLALFERWFYFVFLVGISCSTAAVAQMQPAATSGSPGANAFTATVQENSFNNVIPSQTTGSPTSLQITSTVSNGVLTVSGLDFIYTPNAGFSGFDTFFYTASNATQTSTPARVSISVVQAPPTSSGISVSFDQNSSNNVISTNITGTSTTITILTAPTHGTASVSGLNLIYTPAAGYVGNDSLIYQTSNSDAVSASVNVSIIVNAIPPVANTISTSVAQNSSANSINPSINGSATSIAISSAPAHGSASVSGMMLVYTPAANYFGTDSFSYIATNGSGNSAPATVNISVNQVAPTAFLVRSAVLENSSNNIVPSSTIGTVSSIALTSLPANGSASVSGLNVIYTPNAGFVGTDNLKYVAINAAGTSANASMIIEVSRVAPIANPVTASVVQNSANNSIGSNVIGSGISIVIDTPPSHGTLSVSGLNMSYTPTAGYVGSDSFTYMASNSAGTSAPADVSIVVTAIPPVANTISTSVAQNSSANAINPSINGSATS
uniref:Ig-like domain-containing protein n=1 Tax=Undibacterium sp. TaxID=1914977 RepID=UPI003752FEF0